MNTAVFIIVLLMAVCGAVTQSTESTTTTTTTLAPLAPNVPKDSKLENLEIHYKCDTGTGGPSGANIIIEIIQQNISQPSNTIDTYAVSKDPFDYNLQDIKTDQTLCTQGLSNLTSDPKFTLSGCNLEETRYVYVLKNRTHIIYGGKDFHFFEIDCSLKSVKPGATYEVSESLTGITNNTKMMIHENPDLSLTLTTNPTGTLKIGDSLNVTVTDGSNPVHHLAFLTCTARDHSDTGVSVELLKNGLSKEKDIVPVDPVPSSKPGTAKLTLSVFRFSKSDKVDLTCTILACQTQCQLPVSKRRKRSSDDNITNTVQTTFTVTDKMENSGQDKVICSYITVLALILATEVF